jgi:hypothetical protein
MGDALLEALIVSSRGCCPTRRYLASSRDETVLPCRVMSETTGICEDAETCMDVSRW